MTETIYCAQCGTGGPAGGGYCQKCGATLYWASPASSGTPAIAVQPYAGFWVRVAATIIDNLVLGVLTVPIIIVLALRLAAQSRHVSLNGREPFLPVFMFFATLLPVIALSKWLYEALLTSSAWQGTVGKHILGLK